MNNKKILNIVTMCIIILVPFLKFFSMNLEFAGLINYYAFINPAIILYVSVPVLIYVYISDIIKSKRKLDIYDYLICALTFASILSTIFALNKNIAVFGKFYRHEGLLSILSYIFLFINWHVFGTKEDAKKYLKIFIIIGILNSIYALLQIYTPFNFIIRYEKDYMASGMCGNPNFFGSLIVTLLSIITYKLLSDKKYNYKLIILLILFFISLINCQSTGPFLTYIVVLIFIITYLNKNIKNLLLVLGILILTYIAINFINLSLKDNTNELGSKGLSETVETGGSGRLEIWKNSLDIVKKYPITGVGYDNFYLAYPNDFTSGFTMSITADKVESKQIVPLIYDNAHNVYLHTLVSTGILGLISYLLLCLFVFIDGLKSEDKLKQILLIGFIAYSIQAFANISVIQVAPIYYLIMGLMLSIKN